MTKRFINTLLIIGFAALVITPTEAMQQSSIPSVSSIEQTNVQQSSGAIPAESENQQAMTTNYRKQKRRGHRDRRRNQPSSQAFSTNQQRPDFQQTENVDLSQTNARQRVEILEQRSSAMEQRLIALEGQNNLLVTRIQELEATIQQMRYSPSKGRWRVPPGHLNRQWRGNWQGQGQNLQERTPSPDSQSGSVPSSVPPGAPISTSTPVIALPTQATTSQLQGQQNP